MEISISKLALSAYQVVLQRLTCLREHYRTDERAGEFWACALQRVCHKEWVNSHPHWFYDQPNVAPTFMGFTASRFGVAVQASEGFAPLTAGYGDLMQFGT